MITRRTLSVLAIAVFIVACQDETGEGTDDSTGAPSPAVATTPGPLQCSHIKPDDDKPGTVNPDGGVTIDLDGHILIVKPGTFDPGVTVHFFTEAGASQSDDRTLKFRVTATGAIKNSANSVPIMIVAMLDGCKNEHEYQAKLTATKMTTPPSNLPGHGPGSSNDKLTLATIIEFPKSQLLVIPEAVDSGWIIIGD